MLPRYQPPLPRLLQWSCSSRPHLLHPQESPPHPCCRSKHQASKSSCRRLPLSPSLRLGYLKICCRKIIINQPRSRRIPPPAARSPRPGTSPSPSRKALQSPPPPKPAASGVCCPWLPSSPFWAGPDTPRGKVATWVDCFNPSRAPGANPGHLRPECRSPNPPRLLPETKSPPRHAPSRPDDHIQHIGRYFLQGLIDRNADSLIRTGNFQGSEL